jgi:hypothetical protein
MRGYYKFGGRHRLLAESDASALADLLREVGARQAKCARS